MRNDGRGHWPRGKRRNKTDPERVGQVMTSLRVVLATQAAYGSVSRRALAAHLGVSDRAVRWWLGGEDIPTARMLRKIEAWIRRVEKQAKVKQ